MLFELLAHVTSVADLTFRQRGILVSACASTTGDLLPGEARKCACPEAPIGTPIQAVIRKVIVPPCVTTT